MGTFKDGIFLSGGIGWQIQVAPGNPDEAANVEYEDEDDDENDEYNPQTGDEGVFVKKGWNHGVRITRALHERRENQNRNATFFP